MSLGNSQETTNKSKEIVRQFLRFYIMEESVEEIILLCSFLYYNGHRNSREEIWTKFTADMGEVGIFGG